MSKLIRKLVLLIVVLSASGCSETIKHLALNNADWLVMYQLDGYFDLKDSQKEYLKPYVKQHLKWAQKELVPEIKTELQKIVDLERKLTPAEIDGYYFKRTRELWWRLIDQVSMEGAWVFGNLDSDQYEYLREKTNERYEKWTKLDGLEPEEYKEEYRDLQEERLDRLEQWIGEVREDQIQDILAATFITQEEYRREADVMRKVRMAFLDRIIKIKDETEKAAFIKAWTRRPDLQPEGMYDDYREWRRMRQKAFWKTLEKSLSPKQLDFRRKKIAEVINDLRYFEKVEF